ncbi:MAG: ATP-binding protein [Gemmatimonadales bacterium]
MRRPDPDALLARVTSETERARRGRLKIFFGAAPGVGKTFAMLEAARVASASGSRVAIGVVETHGRADTAALAAGLPTIPLRSIEYRGSTVAEFDLDRAIAEAPELILVDELAHTNAPGSRHAKRWQDVEELLTAGINVFTTLNVQHVESLNDVVAQITGVVVRETVPDAVLADADELELVDVSAEVLIQRLREGKVYLPATAERALEQFFRKGNLLALRELALRRTAQHVDADVRAYRADQGISTPWATTERILVCVGNDEGSAQLVRAGRRLAESLVAPWFAVHVDAALPNGGDRGSSEQPAGHFRLAEQLGAEAVRLTGADVVSEIVGWALDHNVTRIVVGRVAARPRASLFRRSLAEALIQRAPGIDITVVALDQRPAPRPRRQPTDWRGVGFGIAAALGASAVGFVLRDWLSSADLAMLYLLAVAIVGTRARTRPAIVTAIASIVLFNFLFVTPYYTFRVADESYLLTFAMMLLIGVGMARLTGRIREDTERLRRRQRETEASCALSREISRAVDSTAVERAAQEHLTRTFAGSVELLFPGPDGSWSDPDPVADWVFQNGKRAGAGTDTLPRPGVLYLPLGALPGADVPLGVVRLRGDRVAELLRPDTFPLVESLLGQIAMGLQRLKLAERNETARVEVEAERLRTSLLSSLSHDLRTPLASIEGAASSLLDRQSAELSAAQADLARTILDEARRMNRLIGNLLEMVRVQSGTLAVQKEWQPLEEVVGIVLIRLDERLRNFKVVIELAEGSPLVPMDGLLIEQVLINLLENATKYAPQGSEIVIGAKVTETEATLTVADRGPGIPDGDEERIFEKFYRATQGAGGIGLGLAICRGIVTAHGGSIRAENRPGGGAIFSVVLPIDGTPPDLLEPEDAEP